jgi:hypothetical protein
VSLQEGARAVLRIVLLPVFVVVFALAVVGLLFAFVILGITGEVR